MHITMFSINPLFPNTVMGGAPKHLRNIALHMGERGHQVTVLCTRTADSETAFQWHPNVMVKPVLPFKQPFPQPYAIPAYDTATILQTVGDHLRETDRFYMHDGELLLPYVYRDVPTVVSLRDNIYPETLLGGFLFQSHRLVLISDYSRRYVEQTVGRFFPELDDRISVIHNGLDWSRFKPTEPEEIFNYVPVRPGERPILLHPHRPEESKGILQTIEVVRRLVHQHGIGDLIALAPRWHDVQNSPELREFYERIKLTIREYDLEDNFVFHGWIPQELMPEYFSLGSVTVSPGYFPESFGNAVYESLGCGTPSIAARISTHRELLPDHLLDKVDYGDLDGMAQVAARIIREGRRTSPDTLAYLHRHYGIERQLNAYADLIETAQVVAPMTYRHPTIDVNTHYVLPVWCYISSQRGVYHDFKADYLPNRALIDLIGTHPDGFARAQAESAGVTNLDGLVRDGYLIPDVHA